MERSFRFGDLNLPLSTEADLFADTDRALRVSSFSTDLRISGSWVFSAVATSFSISADGGGGVWSFLSRFSLLSRLEERRRPRDLDEAEDEDEDRDLRRRDQERLRERRRLLESDSEDEGV